MLRYSGDLRGRFREEEEAEEGEEEEEEIVGVAGLLMNLNIETAVTKEEASEGLEVALGMEVEEDRDSEGEESGEGTQWALGDLEFLNQDAEHQLEAWIKPQVETWSHRVRVLGKISRQPPQLAYASLGILLKLDWQYLYRTVPGVGTLISPIEEALREKFSPEIFRGEEINADFRHILGHIVNHGGLVLLDPWL